MLFVIPYLLTFLSFISYSYLLGTYAFIHKNIVDVFQVSKTQLGVTNGLIGLGSTVGVIVFLMYSTYIKPKIITYYTWSCIGYMFTFILILLGAALSQQPPKLLLIGASIFMGVFRSILFPSLLIIIKMHKQIYDRKNHMNQHNYKLLTNIWSVSFDVGMTLGFFGNNWLEYTINIRWEYLVIIGVAFMLITTTFLFFGLKPYIEGDEDNQLEEDESNPPQNTHKTSFYSFFMLINQYLPSKLFLINSTIIDALHLGFVFVLPPYFYDLGYKGNQGYFTAIYSLFVVFGAWTVAISDFVLHKVSEKLEKSDQSQQVESRDQAKFSFILSVSLFFFALTLIILTILCFQVEDRKKYGVTFDQSNLSLNMILMCSLGFFFGGPLKSYFSYRTIKSMGGLQKVYEKQMGLGSTFAKKEQEMLRLSQKSDISIMERIKSQQLQIGTSLLTTNRILTHFTTIIIFVVSFYFIENYITYAIGFLAFLGVLGFIFDVIQNIVAIQYQKKEQKEQRMKQRLQKLSGNV